MIILDTTQHHQAKKQMTISKLPNVLVLHLKRFSFGNMTGKNTKHVQFTESLIVPSQDGKSDTKSKVKYHLTGIVVHHGGSSHSGHYVAFVKVRCFCFVDVDGGQMCCIKLFSLNSHSHSYPTTLTHTH